MLDIGHYTQALWGVHQSNAYLECLDSSFHLLAKNPELGQACDDVLLGYRKYAEGKHVVFYRIGEDGAVEIIRILHQAMDYVKNLRGFV